MPSQTTTTPQFINPRQLALRWGISIMTLRRWRHDGRLAASRFGRGIRFAISEVERVEANSREPAI